MAKITREPYCQYIYTDGTLIELFEERRAGVEIGQSADVTLGHCQLSLYKHDGGESYRKRDVAGRIVLHRGHGGFAVLAKGGKIEAVMPSLQNGSENTRKRGIEVQHVTLETAKKQKLEWAETPAIISGQFTLQEMDAQDTETLKFGHVWGGSARIMKVTDLRPKPAVAGL